MLVLVRVRVKLLVLGSSSDGVSGARVSGNSGGCDDISAAGGAGAACGSAVAVQMASLKLVVSC